MSVQYSRGCPLQCEFCDIIEIYGRVPRMKSNEQMLAELDALFRLGWRGMVFIPPGVWKRLGDGKQATN